MFSWSVISENWSKSFITAIKLQFVVDLCISFLSMGNRALNVLDFYIKNKQERFN